MRIFLVRHGESHSNVDQSLNKSIPDHEIALSSRGITQTEQAGNILKAFFEKEYSTFFDPNASIYNKIEESTRRLFEQQDVIDVSGLDKLFGDLGKLAENFGVKHEDVRPKIRLYNSPYRRTRETASIIKNCLGDILFDVKEDALLHEQTFGIFDGLEDSEQEKKFPEEFECFSRAKKFSGKFFARYPNGESAADTYLRLKVFIQSLKEDEEEGISDVIIVCHGTVLRLFTMAYLNKSHEWFAAEPGPGNTAIRILDKKADGGYLWGGYRDGIAWEYKGNKK